MSSLATALLCCLALASVARADVLLATFDGSQGTSYQWRVENDPVMGGVSVSSAYVNKSLAAAVWDGEVKIVPSLNAPGFCEYLTDNAFTSKFRSAEGYTHLFLQVRTSTPSYSGFKVSFAAESLNPQFKSFKANFNISEALNNTWTVVAIPFNSFSNDWSPYTGNCDTKDPTGKQHHCCSAQHPEVCPTRRDLAHIQQLGVWTEGAAGKFHLEIQWIGAGNLTEAGEPALLGSSIPFKGEAKGRDSCSAPIQSSLRYNVSGRFAVDYLPVPGLLPLEGLAFAVCCDSKLSAYAEPANFYAEPDIDLFSKMAQSGPTIFYDSSCGLPVFIAPINRTFADFKADTTEHTWPSFRPGEIYLDNVVINATSGEIRSKCGTHLGSLDPDARGERYCIDLSCISGNPAKRV